MIIIYRTDCPHSYASRDIIGLATDKITAIDICRQAAKKENEKISKDQLWNLEHILQTQGYSGIGEFQLENVEVDTLI